MQIRSFVALAFITSMSVGCAQNGAYRSGEPASCAGHLNSDGTLSVTDSASACRASFYQKFDGFDMAFAEFSERGNAFDLNKIDTVVETIRQRANNEGVVVVTFIHGWKHDANEDDSNVHEFRRTLATLSQQLLGDVMGRRRLVGLYIGWRGSSLDVPGLENTTFWDRKAVAQEIGKGGVSRLLLALDAINDHDNGASNTNVFVTVGHSFGGAIVVSALAEVLTERVIHRTKRRGYATGVGDAVIVLNPAIEANQALNLVEAALLEPYPRDQHPIFVSISTDADVPTHKAFPVGQTVGLLMTWKQSDLVRPYLYDRENVAQGSIPLREEHLDTTTVGNFAPFLTHRLSLPEGSESFEFDTCAQAPAGCAPMGFTTLAGQPTIHAPHGTRAPRQHHWPELPAPKQASDIGLPAHYPLFFIKTDETVMSGHNDIFNPKIKAFMYAFIDDVVRRELEGNATVSILHRTKEMQDRANRVWKSVGQEH